MTDNIKDFLNPKAFQLLYFNFRYAIITNNQKEIELYKSLINKVLQKNKEVFDSLNDYKKSELQKLIKISNTGSSPITLLEEIPPGNIVEIFSKSEYEIPEKELNDSIFEGNISKINELINRNLRVISQEHQAGNFGFVDITAKDDENDEFWILELKTGTANHKVIGQVAKYIQYFEGRLMTKNFEKVRALTVCGGYDNYSLRELKKIGVNTLRYQNIKGTLIFESI